MKWMGIFLLSLHSMTGLAQFYEDFSDGNFNVNPTWSGDTNHFLVTPPLTLQLNAPSAGTSVLCTSSKAIISGMWHFKVTLDFNPSSSNYLKVYLVSSHAQLQGPLNGYFVKIGGSEDEVSLYYQHGVSETKIIDGRNDRINNNPVELVVSVKRNAVGDWELLVDSTATAGFITEGKVFHDSLLYSSYFGFQCNYTSTRADKFYFDDIQVSGTTFMDTVAPHLRETTVLSGHELLLRFSEPIDTTSALNTSNYVVDQGVNFPIIIRNDSIHPAVVTLEFSDPFPENVPLTMKILHLTDTAGNFNDTIITTFEHHVYAAAQLRDIVINELLADPDPPEGLPEKEYIELFNNSGQLISLYNWTLSDPLETAVLPEIIMSPGEFMIVCTEKDTALFQSYGRTLGLAKFPGLNNQADELWLSDSSGTIIDHLSFDISWYQDKSKSAGGWSLEKIDPDHLCEGMNNWGASIDALGGTPGKINSIYAFKNDNVAPKISTVIALNDSSLALTTDKPLDTFTVASNAVFTINGMKLAKRILYKSGNQQLVLALKNSLPPGDHHILTTNNLTDCYGNTSGSQSIPFIVPSGAMPGDVIINEVLFNPHAGGSDFVEIYNRSDQYLDLFGWQLANIDLQADTMDGHQVIIEEPYLLPPASYVVISEDSLDIRLTYPRNDHRNFIQTDLPAYNDDKGVVCLLNAREIMTDRFDYHRSMHFAILRDVEGVSLERIHPDRPGGDLSNWHSASENSGYATPGYQNSQYKGEAGSGIGCYLEPEIFSPDNDGQDDVINIHYQFDKGSYSGHIFIYDLSGRLIAELANNTSFSVHGIISWDGIDSNGDKAGIGIYIAYLSAVHPEGNVVEKKLPFVVAHSLGQ